jgi:phage tail sheath protein FI
MNPAGKDLPMPATRTYKTPGVYVAELSAFPPSVVGVQTAIPAFIGYTQKAEIGGRPVVAKPVAITSMAEFEQVFGGPHKAFYRIQLVPDADLTANPDDYDFRVKDPFSAPPTYKYYKLVSKGSSFNLYNSMRLFYANGGGNCYVVSAGLYETIEADGSITPNEVEEENLALALDAISEQIGPTMLVVPDAVLLASNTGTDPWKSDGFANIAKKMLTQSKELQDRVSVLDVYGTQYLSRPPAAGKVRPTLDQVIERFRADVGSEGLSYGMAYFPFLDTTVVPVGSLDFTALENEDTGNGTGILVDVLTRENKNLYGDPATPGTPTKREEQVQADIDLIPATVEPTAVRKLNDNLTAALALLAEMLATVVNKEDLLPPSAALAGVMTYVDANRGVWNAPANITLASVARPSFLLNGDQQSDLNVPVDGKAVDALREFPGRGTVVWGARTLDGNSNDYRYIQVRRTLIYIEQSIKNALNQFVFAPNTGQTWTTVVSMASSFLQGVWSQGGLMGATASDAFSVQCGLGSTMTGQDVLEGYMIVQVTLQMIRPAEFIELTFKQKMEGVA